MDQVAAVLGCSPGAVKSQGARALDRLRVTAVNLTTGHQASIAAAQIPYLDAAFNTAAW